MRNTTKMLMLSGRNDRTDMRYPDMVGGYNVQDRFRDRRGREHYDNGRYAPQSAKRGTLTWDNTTGEETGHRDMEYSRTDMNYPRYDTGQARSMMDEPESRRRRDRLGRFRSEMDGDSMGDMEMRHNEPHYPPPVYERMNQIGFSAHDGEERGNLHMIRGGAAESMELDESTAKRWMNNLENEDGTTGPHWTIEQTSQVLKQKGIKCDPLEFWVAMNAVYSDYVGVAKKMNVNSVDFYAAMAKAFISDKDSVPNRLAKYYQYIVRH